MRAIALFVVAGCGSAAPVPAPASASPALARGSQVVEGDYAFVHAHVVPMDSERVLDDQTVVIRGDTIAAIGPTATIQPGVHARVIDATGAYLMPGLSDMHAHVNDTQTLTLLVANGVTTVRNMWGSRETLKWRAEIASGKRIGPTIFTAGPIIDGDPPQWDGSTGVADAAAARAAVDAQHEAGYDFIKIYNRLTVDAFDAIVAEATRLGMHVGGHVPVAVGLERVLASRLWSIEHLTGYFDAAQRADSPLKGAQGFKERVKQADSLDDSKLAALVNATKNAGTWNVPTLVVWSKFVPPSESGKLMARPEMRFVPPLVRASWDPTKDYRTKDWRAEDYASVRHGNALRSRLVHDLHAAGARLVTGTDFPNPFVLPGFAIHEELALFVAAGLTPFEALRASTADAAEFLGGNFGTIAPGRRADLLLVDGNPLANVGNAAKRRGVMVHGVWLSEAELAQQLEGLAHAWDESTDRLAKLAPLPGAVTFTARLGGVFAGKERVARDAHRIITQSVFDDTAPGSLVIETKESFDDRGGLAGFEVTRTGGGELHAALTIVRGRLVGEVVAGTQPALKVDEPLGDAIFTTTATRTFQLSIERARAKKLAVGKKLVVPARDFDIEPRVHVVNVTETVTRLPDAAGKQRYQVDEKRPNGAAHSEVVVDADGSVRSAHTVMQIGELELTRD